LLLQRVVDIESANARQRGKREPIKQTLSHSNVNAVDRASSQSEASEGTSIPISRVLLEADRITHDHPEDLERQETGDATDVSDDEDEEKYHVKDTPRVKSELKVKQEEIMMPVDEDDAFDDYVAWLLRRQKLYPFEDKKSQKLYVPRHSLLSPNGRLREYSRFGFLTSWDIRLFGELANRWFRRLLHDYGVARDGDKKSRSVSIHQVRVPMMSYDTRDRLSTVRTGEENELPFNSFTLSGLPLLLRGDPGLALARAHSLSLQEEADIYVNQRKRNMITKGQIDVDSDDDDESSNSEFQAEPPHMREQASIRHVSAGAATFKHVKTEAIPASVSSVAHRSFVDNVQSTVMMSGFDAREPKTDTMPSLVEEESVSYPAQRLKQESVIRVNRLQKEEQDRVGSLTDIDRIEESASVLGSILSRAFTPAVRATLRAGKLAVGTRLTGKDRIAAVDEMKKSGVTFSGDRMKAPAYLKRLCATVLKWDLTAGEVYQVMDSTMDKQAATWLQDTWAMTGELPTNAKPIEALLDSFMRLWMDQTTRRMFRDALKSLRMPTETATLDELNMHYSKFSEYLNGLRMCDRHVDMQDIIHEYFETLPNRVQAFIGTRYMSALSIAEVHAEAETALRTMHKRRTPTQDGDLADVVGVHALTESVAVNAITSKPRERSRGSAVSRNAYEKQEKREVVCYHCGNNGHYAGVECPHINQPQTRRGQIAWAEYNQNSANPRPYDKDYYIERSRQYLSQTSVEQSTVTQPKPASPSSSASSAIHKKKVTFKPREKKQAQRVGRETVSGAPLSKKTAQPELDEEDDETEEA
jgi:hypothetical protein